jgi:hypothetical protein
MTEQTTKTNSNSPQGLRLNQRNLLRYFCHHRARYPNSPCFVPRSSVHHLDQHLKALEKLEDLKLITVIRETNHYQGWLMVPYIQK